MLLLAFFTDKILGLTTITFVVIDVCILVTRNGKNSHEIEDTKLSVRRLARSARMKQTGHYELRYRPMLANTSLR